MKVLMTPRRFHIPKWMEVSKMTVMHIIYSYKNPLKKVTVLIFLKSMIVFFSEISWAFNRRITVFAAICIIHINTGKLNSANLFFGVEPVEHSALTFFFRWMGTKNILEGSKEVTNWEGNTPPNAVENMVTRTRT